MYKNNQFKLLYKILIVLFSYGYIYYKFKSLQLDWHAIKLANSHFILIVIGLMPVNWVLESTKWQFLLRSIEKIPLIIALKGVLVGITTGLATPNRVGEYVGRTFVLKKHNRVKGSLATMLGSWAQVLVTLILGLIGWIILFEQVNFFNQLEYRPLFMGFLLGLMLLMLLVFYNLQWVKRIMQWFNINKKYTDEVSFLNRFHNFDLSYILLLSLLRYTIFASQYIILLRAFGADISIINSLAAIFLIYLIIIFIPHFSITELGVRASISIFVFQAFTTEIQAVAMAASFLWFINLVLPSVIGSFYLLTRKTKKAS